jgi:hypothetical protein
MIGDCMALFRDKSIREKYQFYLKGGGVSNSYYKPNSAFGLKIKDSEMVEICKQYADRVPLYTIANNVQRCPDSVRNVLKRKGVYDKGRESPNKPIEGYTKTKTVRV